MKSRTRSGAAQSIKKAVNRQNEYFDVWRLLLLIIRQSSQPSLSKKNRKNLLCKTFCLPAQTALYRTDVRRRERFACLDGSFDLCQFVKKGSKLNRRGEIKFFLTNRCASCIMTRLISAVPKFPTIWRRNSVGRVPGSYPVCHLFKSGRRYQARWSSG